MGDLLDSGPAGAAVQTRRSDDSGAVRGTAGAHRGGNRRGLGRGEAPPGGQPGPPGRESAMTGPRAGSRGRAGSPTAGRRGQQRNSRAASADLAAGPGGGTPIQGAEPKALKNEACSLGLFQRYRDEDYVSPRTDPAAKILSVPRPAGVILALTPSTNPVCTVFFKVILALLTRNAIVVSPHPMAQECCGDAVRMLAAAATEAGAPDGVISLVEDVTVPLIEALMADPVTSVIVATGGTAVVRAAHRSGNPAL